jgi:hypothetical protein
MVFGRLVGWALVGLALLMASGDAVLALGPGDHIGIAARDIYVLLAGKALQPAVALMKWPAWAFIGPAGVALLWTCRPRRRRYRFRSLR